MRNIIVALLLLSLSFAGCIDGTDGGFGGLFGGDEPDADTLALLEELSEFPEWQLNTDHGLIRMVLYTDWLPQTTGRIIRATDADYYSGTQVYRVVDDFVIQGGDESEDEADEAGTTAEDSGVPLEYKGGLDFGTGAVGLARSVDPDSGTTHYFITEKPAVHLSTPYGSDEFQENPSPGGAQYLLLTQGEPYALYGQVFEGMDHVRAIAAIPTNADGVNETDDDQRPSEDVNVRWAKVLDPPEDADLLNLIPDVFPDVTVSGYTGIFEAPRIKVTDHPATFRFSVRFSETCGVRDYTLVHPDGERVATPWAVDPIDGCAFESTLTFDEPGTYTFDFGVDEIEVHVLPWSDAYAAFDGNPDTKP